MPRCHRGAPPREPAAPRRVEGDRQAGRALPPDGPAHGPAARARRPAPLPRRRPGVARPSASSKQAHLGRKTADARPTVEATSRSRPPDAATGPIGRTRLDRGQACAAETRRNRIPVVLGAAAAAVILATSFPLSVLLEPAPPAVGRGGPAVAAEAPERPPGRAEPTAQLQRRSQAPGPPELPAGQPGQALYDILPPAGTTTPTARCARRPATRPTSRWCHRPRPPT